MLSYGGSGTEYGSFADAVSIPAVMGRYVKELAMFLSSLIIALAYFMLKSNDQEHVSFVFLVILFSFVLIFGRYWITNDFATMKANIYNEYIRTAVYGTVPIILFFLAEETNASKKTQHLKERNK